MLEKVIDSFHHRDAETRGFRRMLLSIWQHEVDAVFFVIESDPSFDIYRLAIKHKRFVMPFLCSIETALNQVGIAFLKLEATHGSIWADKHLYNHERI